MCVTEFERLPKMTWLDFVSGFGGLCGLCLGISFVSLVEILYWFSIRLCKNFQIYSEQILQIYFELGLKCVSVILSVIVSKNDDIVIVLPLQLVLSAHWIKMAAKIFLLYCALRVEMGTQQLYGKPDRESCGVEQPSQISVSRH